MFLYDNASRFVLYSKHQEVENIGKDNVNATKEFYSTQELAELLGLSQRTIYRYIDSGELIAFKLGDQWRISRVNLDKFVETRQTNQKK